MKRKVRLLGLLMGMIFLTAACVTPPHGRPEGTSPLISNLRLPYATIGVGEEFEISFNFQSENEISKILVTTEAMIYPRGNVISNKTIIAPPNLKGRGEYTFKFSINEDLDKTIRPVPFSIRVRVEDASGKKSNAVYGDIKIS